MIRIISILTILTLILSGSGCRLAYILHAGAGQFRMLHGAIPVEKALKNDSLRPEQKDLLRLVARIKNFGEKELGLKKTQNYQTVYLKSDQSPIFTVSASPKDRLTRITWWFPVVGKMPYLGFFDLERARAEKKRLIKKDLDVVISKGDAYSTLGWFKDPVTLNLLEGTTVDLVETILHEMTHTTLYVKGEGEFNEGLAVLVGMVGASLFLERTCGPSHPLTIEAQKSIEDELLFSSFLTSLFEKLERLYNSPVSFQEKLAGREAIFSRSLEGFGRLKSRLQTERFIHFGSRKLNNASLMSIGLYHRHFHLFETVLKEKGNSIKKTLLFFHDLSKEKGDILEKAKGWLKKRAGS
ncbi:MAG: aminopeptidase [Deltaproteobacteria bacterium]|nr:aminopeptidase [Deltaproteobacteria bacterium]